jgi:hypothetical protein
MIEHRKSGGVSMTTQLQLSRNKLFLKRHLEDWALTSALIPSSTSIKKLLQI